MSPIGSKSIRFFTLLEIIVVILVIAMITSLAVVNMDSLIPTSLLKKHIRSVSNTMELALAQATIKGRDLSLRFDTEERKMILEYFVESLEEEALILEELGLDDAAELEPIWEQSWGEGLVLESLEIEAYGSDDPREVILFSPYGYSDGARITWVYNSQFRQSLEIWPLLGKISIEPVEELQ